MNCDLSHLINLPHSSSINNLNHGYINSFAIERKQGASRNWRPKIAPIERELWPHPSIRFRRMLCMQQRLLQQFSETTSEAGKDGSPWFSLKSGERTRRREWAQQASVVMQRLSNPTETVLSNKITRNRVLSFTDSSQKTISNFQMLHGAITVFNSLVEKKIKPKKRATCRPAAAGKNCWCRAVSWLVILINDARMSWEALYDEPKEYCLLVGRSARFVLSWYHSYHNPVPIGQEWDGISRGTRRGTIRERASIYDVHTEKETGGETNTARPS